MDSTNSIISIRSDDLSYFDLKKAVSQNADDIILFPVASETNRSFQDVEWIMFTLMIVPVAESLFNIVTSIKNAIKGRVSKLMVAQNIVRSVKIKIKIKLPFYSYEKEEIIVVPITNESEEEDGI